MHLACGYKIHLALGNEGIQIRLMLEEVGIQLLIVQSQIRFYIIAEFDNLQVYALFSQSAFNLVQDFSVRYSGSTNLKGYLLSAPLSAILSPPPQPAATTARLTNASNATNNFFIFSYPFLY